MRNAAPRHVSSATCRVAIFPSRMKQFYITYFSRRENTTEGIIVSKTFFQNSKRQLLHDLRYGRIRQIREIITEDKIQTYLHTHSNTNVLVTYTYLYLSIFFL